MESPNEQETCARVLPFVHAEPVEGRTPAAVVLGDQIERVRLRGGLAVLETKAGTVVLIDADAVKLAAIALRFRIVR